MSSSPVPSNGAPGPTIVPFEPPFKKRRHDARIHGSMSPAETIPGRRTIPLTELRPGHSLRPPPDPSV